jgi:hydroxyacylglutathione hydrolase
LSQTKKPNAAPPPENAEPYARQMFHSLRDKLLAQQDYVGVLPTHGGGSLCSKDIASTPSSTIGYERRHNELLTIAEIEPFVRALLDDQPAVPRYFARMRPINKTGAAPLGAIAGPRALTVAEVQALLADDALIIDTRPYREYAAGHLPGAYSIPAGSSFGTWLGWVVPVDRPLILVLDQASDWDDVLRQALRIGYDDVRGHLSSVADWRAAGLPLETGKVATIQDLAARLDGGGPDAPLVLDVRQHYEWVEGHIPGSVHLMGGDLPDRLAELPRDRPIVTICRSAYRSAVAASILERAGFKDVTWIDKGVPAWRRAGLPIVNGD